MNRQALESLDKEALIDLVLTLAARVAELEAKLGLPPKTPDNSSTPPSQGKKPSADPTASGCQGPRASVIETARRRAIGVLDAIRATLNGSPLDGAASLLTATEKG